MKKLQKKDLTQNQMINKYLLSGVELNDEFYDDDDNANYLFIEILAYEYDCKRLTHDELLYILYDIFQIDKQFNSYSELVINQLALLGLETHRILNSDYTYAKKLLVLTNQHLNELNQDDNDSIRKLALQRSKLINKVKHTSKEMKLLFDSLTHRECRFHCINKTACELIIPNSLYWCYKESGIRFMVVADNEYIVASIIDEFTDSCFENGIRQGLELRGITHTYKDDRGELCIRHKFNDLSKLVEFITWAGVEISHFAYDIEN